MVRRLGCAGTTSKMKHSLRGPTAAWLDEDSYVYEHVMRHAIILLRQRLSQRLALLDEDELPPPDVLIDEIRRQMGAAVIDGEFQRASDFNDLFQEIILAVENKRIL